MYAVILAGGGGTRLWPLQRRARPKPFLPLLGDQSLFQLTLGRIAPLIAAGTHPCRRGPAPPAARHAAGAAVDRPQADRRAVRPQHSRGRGARRAGHRATRQRHHGRAARRSLDRRRARLPQRPDSSGARRPGRFAGDPGHRGARARNRLRLHRWHERRRPPTAHAGSSVSSRSRIARQPLNCSTARTAHGGTRASSSGAATRCSRHSNVTRRASSERSDAASTTAIRWPRSTRPCPTSRSTAR